MKKIQINSKHVKTGDIFVAINCSEVESNIKEALANGASMIVLEKNSATFSNSKFLYTEDSRLTASKLAAFCYSGHPSHCLAVTGTNGKSSVVHFLSQIWSHLQISNSNLGTNGLFINGEKDEEIFVQPLTTPDCVNLHQILTFLSEKNISHFAFEASSHAIDQKRLHSVPLNVAAFTNLTSDHLDYHHTKEAYFETKQRIFTEVQPQKAVFSRDDTFVFDTLKNLHNDYITFGYSVQNDVSASNIREFPDKVILDISCFGEKYKAIKIQIFGGFQISNVLCSVAMAIADGSNVDDIIQALPHIAGLSGRMEYIASKNGGHIYIDYAHTENAFENALTTFKNACKNRLITIFGCGGNRDKSKRALMGATAAKIADVNIITDDNPRSEPPGDIRQEIMQNCPEAIEIGSRIEAIKYGISILQNGDFLAIIGKGNETIQIHSDKIIDHNDKKCVIENINL